MQIPSKVKPNSMLFKVVTIWLCCFSKHKIDILTTFDTREKGGKRKKNKEF